VFDVTDKQVELYSKVLDLGREDIRSQLLEIGSRINQISHRVDKGVIDWDEAIGVLNEADAELERIKKEVERVKQTDLCLDQLERELDNPTSHYPRCLLINEIGGIAEASGEEAEKAKSFLCQLLNSKNFPDKFLAYCYLSTNRLNEVAATALKAFVDNPQNAEIIAMAIRAMRRKKAPNN